jgi:hypothetical protein
LQPAEVVAYPEVSEEVPGYTPPMSRGRGRGRGRGYHALRDGSVVFVRTPGRTRSSGYVPAEGSTNLPSVAIPGLTTPVNVRLPGLTQPGPKGQVWSWQQVRRTLPPTSMLSILAQASSSTLISNPFELLHVERIEDKKTMALDADLAYNAHRSSPDACPVKTKLLKKAFREAREAVLETINAPSCAANPYPSVDPPFREYYVDPFEESPPPGPIDEGYESGESVGDNPLDF